MANRSFKRTIYTYEQDIVEIFVSMTVGATGAVGTVKGPATIARTGTGAYTITLADAFHRLLGVQAVNMDATSSAIVYWQVPSDTADADIRSKQVKVAAYSATATAADPANGSKIVFRITARNSSVGPWD